MRSIPAAFAALTLAASAAAFADLPPTAANPQSATSNAWADGTNRPVVTQDRAGTNIAPGQEAQDEHLDARDPNARPAKKKAKKVKKAPSATPPATPQ
jgi:hypothetical protein